MTSFLAEQVFVSLARAAQKPDANLFHPKKQPVVVSSKKNLLRVHKLRKQKQQSLPSRKPSFSSMTASVQEVSDTLASSETKLALQSVAQQLSLARDIAYDLYASEELSKEQWQQTKKLLLSLSAKLTKKIQQRDA